MPQTSPQSVHQTAISISQGTAVGTLRTVQLLLVAPHPSQQLQRRRGVAQRPGGLGLEGQRGDQRVARGAHRSGTTFLPRQVKVLEAQ